MLKAIVLLAGLEIHEPIAPFSKVTSRTEPNLAK
jgi:hypothetical protein